MSDKQHRKTLADNGMLIHAGFESFAKAVCPDAPPEVLANMQIIFFAGANYLYTSILEIMNGEGDDDEHVSSIKKISEELQEFVEHVST